MKVYIPSENFNCILYTNKLHDLPFHFETENKVSINDFFLGNYFQITHNIEESDIIPIMVARPESGITVETQIDYLGPAYKDKWLVMMLHSHCADTTPKYFNEYHLLPWKDHTDKIFLVDINQANTKQVTYDYLFNRQKAYFVEYDKFDLTDRLNTQLSSKKMFELDDIPNFSNYTDIWNRNPYHNFKKFLLSNRYLPERNDNFGRNLYRTRIIKEKADDLDCYWSNWDINNLNLLNPQERIFKNFQDMYEKFGGWAPVANSYYQTSFVSVYVETLTQHDNTKNSVVTEKTFDPLIKGHFILPFGYKGLIADITTRYKFKLPDWIDYSYDDISDIDERFDAFLSVFDQLRQKPVEYFVDQQINDREILEHNRQVFFKKPYDSLYQKIKTKLKS